MRKILCLLLFICLALSACAPVPDAGPSPSRLKTPEAPSQPVPPAGSSAAPEPSASPLLPAKADIPAYHAYVSRKKGEKVSELLTTGDLARFFPLEPEALLTLLGGDYTDAGFVEADGAYEYVYENPGITFLYRCSPAEETAISPLKSIRIHDYLFRGLNTESDFDAAEKKLGKARIAKVPWEGAFAYAVRYKFGSMTFLFTSDDEAGEEGTALSVYPAETYKKYVPLNTAEIGRWFTAPKPELIKKLGGGYTVYGAESGISGVYNDYDYKEKGISLHFGQEKLLRLELDGRYRVGGSKKAETFPEIVKVLGKGVFEETEDGLYTLTYTYKNFMLVFSSYEEDGFQYGTDIRSPIQ
jgi:hypothetical protein